MEEVRSDKYLELISRSEMSIDFEDFETMNQLQLNKLILKYKNQLTKCILNSNPYEKKLFLRKHFKFEDKDLCQPIARKGDLYYNKKLMREYLVELKLNLRKTQDLYDKNKKELAVGQKAHYNEHQKECITCECGASYSRRNKQKHLTTHKHLLAIAKIEEEVGRLKSF